MLHICAAFGFTGGDVHIELSARPPKSGYAAGVMEALRVAGLRSEVDDRSESVGKRIRDGQRQKVPYLLVVGDRESDAHAVSVRARGEETGSVPIEEFVREVTDEVAERRLPEVAP